MIYKKGFCMDLKNDKDILQNLKDADCSNELIKEFFKIKESGLNRQLIRLLYKHKAQLLDCLHASQKKIDCLDYLIFQINQAVSPERGEL